MKKTYTFEAKEDEIAIIERSFELSGFRSRSELIRFVLLKELPNYYGEKDE